MLNQIPFSTNDDKIKKRNKRTKQLHIPIQKSGIWICKICSSEKKPTFLNFFFDQQKIKISIKIICINTRCTKSRGRAYIEEFDLIQRTPSDDLQLIIKRGENKNKAPNASVDFYNKIDSIKGFGEVLIDNLIKKGFDNNNKIKNASIIDLKMVKGITEDKAKILKSQFK